jgi:hypothetical protein
MLSVLTAPGSPADTVRGWRCRPDADRELTVDLDFTDSGEQITVSVLHHVLIVTDDIADRCDAVIALTATDLDGNTTITATPRCGPT